MGKLRSFDINLRAPKAVFLAGATIEGQVNLELNEEMKLKGKPIRVWWGKISICAWIQMLLRYLLNASA